MKIQIFFFCFILLCCTSLAEGQILTFQFTGTITSTNAGSVNISEVAVGDKVSGAFTYDLNSSDAMPSDPMSGLYNAPSLTLTITGNTYSASDNNVSITNNAVLLPGAPAVDAFEVVSPLREVSGPSSSGLSPAQIDLVMVDTDATAFNDDSLPASVNLADFEIVSEVPYGTTGGRLIFQSLSSGQAGVVRFQIDTITVGITGANSYTVFIPHITGGSPDWNDYLQVNNLGTAAASFTIGLYDSKGRAGYSGTFEIGSMDQSLINLKSLLADAQLGRVTYNEPGLTFRISQENVAGGGIAEFVLTDALNDSLAFYFSDFSPVIGWKGLALSNHGNATAVVTLTMLGDGAAQGQSQVSIAPHQKIVGLYQTWFPGVDFSKAQAIRATSASATLSGEAISGGLNYDRLVFGLGQPIQSD